MSEPIDYQIIKDKKGSPAFVVIPYDDYLDLTNKRRPPKKSNESDYIPHEVVEKTIMDNKSIVRSWREHLQLTQREMGKRMGISQGAYSQMEKPKANLKPETLTRIANAMGIDVGQLES